MTPFVNYVKKCFHIRCEKISKELNKIVKRYSDQLWFCKNCKSEIKTSIEKNKVIRGRKLWTNQIKVSELERYFTKKILRNN